MHYISYSILTYDNMDCRQTTVIWTDVGEQTMDDDGGVVVSTKCPDQLLETRPLFLLLWVRFSHSALEQTNKAKQLLNSTILLVYCRTYQITNISSIPSRP
jgi:hypothetical protein